jgi:Sec7-like guanine-nucleotide exchange factor
MYKHSVPSLRIDSAEPSPQGMGTGESIGQSAKSIDEPDVVVGDPTEDDRQKAQKIYEGSEDFIQKDRAAAWMGEEGIVRQRTLRAYMELYDFESQSVVASLRQVCHRLLLRAETQQVDRILVAFSKRWCECNPSHGFKSAGK